MLSHLLLKSAAAGRCGVLRSLPTAHSMLMRYSSDQNPKPPNTTNPKSETIPNPPNPNPKTSPNTKQRNVEDDVKTVEDDVKTFEDYFVPKTGPLSQFPKFVKKLGEDSVMKFCSYWGIIGGMLASVAIAFNNLKAVFDYVKSVLLGPEKKEERKETKVDILMDIREEVKKLGRNVNIMVHGKEEEVAEGNHGKEEEEVAEGKKEVAEGKKEEAEGKEAEGKEAEGKNNEAGKAAVAAGAKNNEAGKAAVAPPSVAPPPPTTS